MRRVAIVVVGLAIVGAIVWRSTRQHDEKVVPVASGKLPTIIRGERRPDPKTMVRGSIAGTVRADGRALVGAQVCATGSSPQLADEVLRDPTCTTTDAGGRYKLAGLLPAHHEVSASARTYQPAAYRDVSRQRSGLELGRGEHRGGVDLELHPGGVEITGTVSELAGGPIVGARVLARSGPWSVRAMALVETDARGRYAAWVAPGGVQIDVQALAFADESELGQAPGTVDVKLTPAATLSGTVVDAASKSPVEGVRVGVYQMERGFVSHTFTDGTGAFHMRGLAPGRHVVVAHAANGWGRSEGSVLVSLGQPLTGLAVQLHPATRVRGKLRVSSTQQPCGTVGPIGSLSDPARARSAVLHAESDGTVWADGVLPGTYQVELRCDGFASRSYPPLEVRAAPIDGVVWEVDPGVTLRGRVLVGGRPVAHAAVSAVAIGATSWARAATDRDGTFELVGLAPGPHTVDITASRGIGPRDGWTIDVPQAGATRAFVLDPGGKITGRVLDGTGAPVAGIEVTAREAGERGGVTTKTDAAGAFALAQLRPGTYHVIAQREWTSLLRKPATTDDERQGEMVHVPTGGQTHVQLTVETLDGTIRGVVVDATGRAVTDAFITLARESDAIGALASRASETRFSKAPVLTSAAGAFAIGNLPRGKYTVRAQRRGANESIAEHVSTGDTVKLVLAPTAAVSGTVTAHGATLDDIHITIQSQMTGFRRDESFYRTAAFVLRDLPPGKLRLTASAEAGEAELDLELRPGSATTGIALVLERPVEVSGHVVDLETRQPVANVVMVARSLRGTTRTFPEQDRANVTDASGRFTIRRAPRGAIVLMGWSDHDGLVAYRTVSGPVTDVGELPLVKRRLPVGTPSGSLGANFAEQPHDTLPDQREHRVSYVDPAGPAAKRGLVVGDVVTSIDGVDIRGANSGLADPLMRAPPGTQLALGLARGVTLHVVLAAP